MKKAKFPAIAATTILCYIFWMLITGQIVSVFCGEASAEVLIAGAAAVIKHEGEEDSSDDNK